MGILALKADERVSGVLFTADSLSVSLMDGRTITVPLVWYPRLLHGSTQQRNHWKISGGGYGIHWPDLDEDRAPRDFFVARLHPITLPRLREP